MILKKEKIKYFFVDEAGDATFYNKFGKCIVGEEGCSKILLLGFICTNTPKELRRAVMDLQKEIANDPYLVKIPSVAKTCKSFHAKDDCPEVREKFYKMIVRLNFKAEFFVARKIEKLFKTKHKGKENIFYDDLIIKLFENKLHSAEQSIIYFAVRGNRDRQQPLEDAIKVATLTFEKKWGQKNNSEIKIYPQTPSDEPCLQIIDYMNWAVQRAFIKGEDRYYKFIEDKVSFLVDIYDFKNYKKNYYSRKNKFEINKISPL
jgi:hypothetical protein